jgi:hypothetical protein
MEHNRNILAMEAGFGTRSGGKNAMPAADERSERHPPL